MLIIVCVFVFRIQAAWYLISMVNVLPAAPKLTIYFHFKPKSHSPEERNMNCSCLCSNCQTRVVLCALTLLIVKWQTQTQENGNHIELLLTRIFPILLV